MDEYTKDDTINRLVWQVAALKSLLREVPPPDVHWSKASREAWEERKKELLGT